MDDLRTTPLTAWHKDQGAKTAPFAGFEMPIQYSSILAEHTQTRTKAGIFDICHMGEFLLSGEGAADALNRVVSHNLETLANGKCRYGFLLNESGGVHDDLIIYRKGGNEFMLVVNGSREEADFAHIARQLPEGLNFKNVSDATAKIDVQGPESIKVIEDVLGSNFHRLKYFNFEPFDFQGASMLVSRTGYTGELGYELYLPAESALDLWEKLAAHDLTLPIGLGARDTLRLECGYPLYGQDLDEEHTPREAGYGFLLKKESEYTGKSGLGTVREKLIPLTIEGRRSARHGDQVRTVDGTPCGEVTSGSYSPTLGHSLALAYVKAEEADANAFVIKTARVELDAKVGELPFYRDGTARMKFD